MEWLAPGADLDAYGFQWSAAHAPDDRIACREHVKLVALGEDALVAALLRAVPAGSNVIAGPGDDCAIIGRPRDRKWTLLKVDCVIEHVHFASDTDPRRVGWKALCRAISDVAAMGGEPRHALITVAAPVALDVA